jgi:hypothetical protein
LSGFPVKTLLYAELFRAPFLIFYVSLAEGKVLFVWVQKYIQAKLNEESSNWRDQKSVTVEFPPTNVLDPDGELILAIAKRYRLRDAGVSFLADYEWLKIHVNSVLGGEIGVAKSALDGLNRLRTFTEFIAYYGKTLHKLDLNDLEANLAMAISKGSIDPELRQQFEYQLEQLEALKLIFLSHDEMDKFAVEHSDENPY